MTKPYTHLLPYLVGMLLGHWLNEQAKRGENSTDYDLQSQSQFCNTFTKKNSKFFRISRNMMMKLSGLLATLVVLSEIFLPYLWNNSQLPSPLIASLYAALFRLGWALSLAYLVISCRHKQTGDCGNIILQEQCEHSKTIVGDGNHDLENNEQIISGKRIWCWCGSGGSLLNQFLSWNIFQHLSRLSFIAYLIHLPLMSVFVAQTRAIFAFSHMLVIHLALSYLLMTFILSFVLVHIIEFPFVSFERYLFEQISARTKHQHNSNLKKNPKKNYTNSIDNELQIYQQNSTTTTAAAAISPTMNNPESA